MLTLVEVKNPRSDTLSLPLMNASAGYVVKDIQGLDPVNAALTTSSMAQLDGEQAQNARRSSRNITMKIGLEPDFVTTTVQSLRANLYNYFMPKANVDLAFHIDGVLFAITPGQVETFENEMFSADPEVDISIICYNPDFHAPEATSVGVNTTTTTDTQPIDYAGTSDAGVVFTLNINRTLASFTLYNTTPDNKIQTFEVDGAFVSGDTVKITSVPGMKSVIMTRSGIDSSILFWVDKAANWISLKNGVNHFRALATGAAIPCTLVYTPQYGGL